jgi:hypothetical protein
VSDACQQPHAPWLETLLVDGPAAVPEGALAAIRACPCCGPELADLADVQAAFESTGRLRRDVLDALARQAASETDEDVRATRAVLERHMRRGRLRLWAGAALAAAAVVLVARVALRERPTDPPPREVRLAPQRASIVAPRGEVAGFGSFRWKEPDGGAASYRVQVSVSVDGSWVEVFERTVEGTELHVDEADWVAWPERIEWRLETLDRSGRVVATDSAEAWRAPR